MENSNKFKVVICGESGVGKTTYAKKLLTSEFEEAHVCTLGVEVHPLIIKTSRGDMQFNLWDMAGRPEFRGIGDGYFAGADAVIVMRTANEKRETCEWERKIKNIFEYLTVVNKCDANIPEGVEMRISTKNDGRSSLLAPFLVLGRKLTGRGDLVFLE